MISDGRGKQSVSRTGKPAEDLYQKGAPTLAPCLVGLLLCFPQLVEEIGFAAACWGGTALCELLVDQRQRK